MFAVVGTQPFEPFGAKGTRNPRSQLTAPVLVKPSEVIRMSMGLRIVVHVCRRTAGKGRKNPRQNPLGYRKALRRALHRLPLASHEATNSTSTVQSPAPGLTEPSSIAWSARCLPVSASTRHFPFPAKVETHRDTHPPERCPHAFAGKFRSLSHSMSTTCCSARLDESVGEVGDIGGGRERSIEREAKAVSHVRTGQSPLPHAVLGFHLNPTPEAVEVQHGRDLPLELVDDALAQMGRGEDDPILLEALPQTPPQLIPLADELLRVVRLLPGVDIINVDPRREADEVQHRAPQSSRVPVDRAAAVAGHALQRPPPHLRASKTVDALEVDHLFPLADRKSRIVRTVASYIQAPHWLILDSQHARTVDSGGEEAQGDNVLGCAPFDKLAQHLCDPQGAGLRRISVSIRPIPACLTPFLHPSAGDEAWRDGVPASYQVRRVEGADLDVMPERGGSRTLESPDYPFRVRVAERENRHGRGG